MSSSTNVYGGDEINAVVLDPGSATTRIGYAGDDFPRVATPSYYGVRGDRTVFGEALAVPSSGLEVRPILRDSVVVDWDGAVAQWTHYFDHELRLDYKEQPLLMTEPVWASEAQRRAAVETIFERFEFPALYLARAPTCVSFQQGRPNCLVVDIGHDSASVTPVVDGISLLRHSMRTHYAGRYLSAHVADFFAKKYPEIDIVDKFKVRSKTPTVYPAAAVFTPRTIPSVTESFSRFQRERLWHEIKESALTVPEKKDELDADARLFELPSGQSVDMGVERYELADALFEPDLYPFSDAQRSAEFPPASGDLDLAALHDYRPVKRTKRTESSPATPPPSSPSGARGLTHLISACLATVDIDLRSSVAHNIIVTGGVSLVPGLTERLYADLTAANPGLKIRLHAVGNAAERCNQSWIGGSVLASLGSFHQMWVSREEYLDAGPDRILNHRFR